MDRKCENCGQFISEKDRFCKYCGAPTPINSNKEKPTKETVKSLEDRIQKDKTIINALDVEGAGELASEKLDIEYLGERSQIKVKNFACIILAFVIALAAVVCFIIVSPIEFSFTYGKVLLMFLCVATLLFCIVVIVERVFNIRGLSAAGEGAIYIKRAGFAHDALMCKGEAVYRISAKNACEICDGVVKGDLHIEKIENRFLAVCNYNRRHFWIVNEDTVYALLGKTDMKELGNNDIYDNEEETETLKDNAKKAN